MRQHVIAGVLATGTAALALAGAASGSGTGASGTEHFSFISTSVVTGKFSVIATGAFTAGGTATPFAKTDTLTFPNGTIKVISKGQTKPVMTASSTTCYETLSQKGAYVIVGGTGAYKGITGSGRFTVSIREIGPFTNGRCDTKTSRRVASQGIIEAAGPVRLAS
jgi:hypothetical protein